MIPAGAHLHYWDSTDEANALVNARGMELQNHWGPVDAHVTLPPERLSALFGTVATYYSPPKPQVPSQSGRSGLRRQAETKTEHRLSGLRLVSLQSSQCQKSAL